MSFLLESLRAFKKTSALATIMLSDINVEFPSLLGQLDKRLADSLSDVHRALCLDSHQVLTSQDFFAFPEPCAPFQIGAIEGTTVSDFIVDPDCTKGATDELNLEEFDFSQESPGAWDLNIYGMSTFPFGRL